MQICHVRCLGLMPYDRAWHLQGELASKIAAGDLPPTLLLLEHPHTYTFGRKGQITNLLWDESELKRRGIEIFWVDRGGDITYHGPGQLVGYPLIPLNIEGLFKPVNSDSSYLPQADYHGYLRKLELVLIDALGRLNIDGDRRTGLTGVWVGDSKIAAIGVKVDAHGITRHGFALNVAPDMTYWDGIIGCGLAGFSVTSLASLLPDPPTMPQVIQAIIASFEAVFEVACQVIT